MRGVVFLGGRKLEIRDFPDPAPGPGEVVLEIKASGMCGSDLKFYRIVGGAQALGLPGDGVQQVRLAVAVGAAEEDGIEVAVGPGRDLFGDGQGEGEKRGAAPGPHGPSLPCRGGGGKVVSPQFGAALGASAP